MEVDVRDTSTTAAYDVWKQSLELPPEERYEFLKRWVLPGDSHPTIRLQVDWTPTDPPPAGPVSQRARGGASPYHVGGVLVSPALELVNVAKELNKLFHQSYQGSRFSFGYPACPNLEDQSKLFELLDPSRIDVELTEEFQLDPEQSTSAIIVHHEEAKYFSIE